MLFHIRHNHNHSNKEHYRCSVCFENVLKKCRKGQKELYCHFGTRERICAVLDKQWFRQPEQKSWVKEIKIKAPVYPPQDCRIRWWGRMPDRTGTPKCIVEVDWEAWEIFNSHLRHNISSILRQARDMDHAKWTMLSTTWWLVSDVVLITGEGSHKAGPGDLVNKSDFRGNWLVLAGQMECSSDSSWRKNSCVRRIGWGHGTSHCENPSDTPFVEEAVWASGGWLPQGNWGS